MKTWHDASGYVRHQTDRYVHVTVAERALGRSLPAGAVVHHVDGNPANNEPSNLVICPSQKYHLLLHARQRVVDAGGHPDTEKVCKTCREVLPKEAFSFETSWDGRAGACRDCTNTRRRGKGYSTRLRRRAACQRL